MKLAASSFEIGQGIRQLRVTIRQCSTHQHGATDNADIGGARLCPYRVLGSAVQYAAGYLKTVELACLNRGQCGGFSIYAGADPGDLAFPPKLLQHAESFALTDHARGCAVNHKHFQRIPTER